MEVVTKSYGNKQTKHQVTCITQAVGQTAATACKLVGSSVQFLWAMLLF